MKESREFVELIDFLLELASEEPLTDIELDFDPYKPGRVVINKKIDGTKN